jgi:F-type H+-transporting ATPase subunit a
MDFFPKTVFTLNLFGQTIEITETVTVTWLIMLILVVFSMYAGKRLETFPRGISNAVEMLVETVDWLVKSTMGEKHKGFTPYIGTLVLYLLFANLIGLVALRPPTADLSTTLALSIITFLLTQYYGLRSKGILTYLKGFVEPIPIMLPMNIIGEVANPFSLAFRLFGNILGGSIIMALLYSVTPVLIPVPLHLYFDVFSGVLQTFIFSMLTMTFIAMAMD